MELTAVNRVRDDLANVVGHVHLGWYRAVQLGRIFQRIDHLFGNISDLVLIPNRLSSHVDQTR